MQSYYEVNVGKCINLTGRGTAPARYKHLFATAPRSITSEADLRIVLDEIKAKFPEPEYQVSANYVEVVGHIIDTSDPKLTRERAY